MTIKFANDLDHGDIGRQLWATLQFRDGIDGIMRFSPKRGQEDRLSRFERACKLKPRIWVGPAQWDNRSGM